MKDMFEPVIKTLLKELDCGLRHDGLDLRLKRDHGHLDILERGPSSYEIMNQGRAFGNDTFPSKAVMHLLDDVIIKYYESKGSVKEGIKTIAQEVVDKSEQETNNFTRLKVEGGQYFSEIEETKEGFVFHTHDKSIQTDEFKQITADLWHLLSLAKEGIEDKTMQVNDQIKMGTLDSDKNTKKLGIWTKDGFVPYEKEHVPKNLLLTTLWYILKLHQGSKHFRNHINLTVEYNGYKAEVKKGEVFLVTEGQSDLVKGIYSDLRKISG